MRSKFISVAVAVGVTFGLVITHPAGQATAQTPVSPQGIIQARQTTLPTTSTGLADQIGYLDLTYTVPEGSIRCVRVEATVRLQSNLGGSSGDVIVKRGTTIRFGSSVYLAASGTLGAATVNAAGVDMLLPGTYTYKFFVDRTGGPGYITTGQATGTLQQSWLEDLGEAVLDGNGGGNCPQ